VLDGQRYRAGRKWLDKEFRYFQTVKVTADVETKDLLVAPHFEAAQRLETRKKVFEKLTPRAPSTARGRVRKIAQFPAQPRL